eukprot:scaffold3165_cov380-Prasinococcus_capsulatus_cf.AAC.8
MRRIVLHLLHSLIAHCHPLGEQARFSETHRSEARLVSLRFLIVAHALAHSCQGAESHHLSSHCGGTRQAGFCDLQTPLLRLYGILKGSTLGVCLCQRGSACRLRQKVPGCVVRLHLGFVLSLRRATLGRTLFRTEAVQLLQVLVGGVNAKPGFACRGGGYEPPLLLLRCCLSAPTRGTTLM